MYKGSKAGMGSHPQLPPVDVMAAPAVSWCLSLLVFLLPLAIPWASTLVNGLNTSSPGRCRSGGQTPEGHGHPAASHVRLVLPAGASKLTCFYNSRANVSCVWSRDGDLQATTCHLHAQPDKRWWNKSCELLPVKPGSWACNLILGPPDSQKLTIVDIISLTVMCCEGERWRRMMTQDFKPFEYIRLMPPHSLQVVHIGTHRCNITWNVSQFSHYIQSNVEFEARTRSPGHSWEDAPLLTLRQNQQWISLETLAPDTLYELQVRARPQLGNHEAWSPWSQPLAFRTRPTATRKKTLPFPWSGNIILGLGGAFAFVLLVYFLANFRYIGPWLKKVLKCHIPDPSEFFSQLSSEHGGDFQKWLSSPFPSSSFSPSGPAPEISPLEVLDRDTKATQLLLLQQQDKGSSSSTETSGHSVTSCFTNQGYFFFHLPDALEIEACQVYFAYDPFTEQPEEGGPGAPEGALLPPLPPLPGEDDAYCTFPPGDDLLLFSPSLFGGPGPPNTALGGTGAGEGRLPPAPQEGVPGNWAPQPLGPPPQEAPDLVDLQSPLEQAPGEAGEEVPVLSPRERAGFPWASPPGQGQIRAPISCLNTDAYLSLQELQDQDPAYSV
ncbi:interleukin-2 receptor subunit beta [Hippopotamus amphibius kiboko]|uniref:interleukin-2 receptor subunit beta n=1 Tax=Hippopotamus amphibius kiboko TaxID=575201 RepID=UPI00259A1B64|nr:interleukin-2 receptor subunit beta [Hippopotamus amphibius kiboko]